MIQIDRQKPSPYIHACFTRFSSQQSWARSQLSQLTSATTNHPLPTHSTEPSKAQSLGRKPSPSVEALTQPLLGSSRTDRMNSTVRRVLEDPENASWGNARLVVAALGVDAEAAVAIAASQVKPREGD